MPTSLNRRLLGWFLLFSIVPLVGTNAIGYRRSHEIIRRLVEHSLSAMALVQAQHVRDRVDRHVLLLEAITAGNEFLAAGARRAAGNRSGAMEAAATRQAVEDVLARKKSELTAFSALYLYTANGAVFASVGPPTMVAAELPRDERRASVSVALTRARTGPEPRFRLVAPITSADGRIAGFLAGTVALSAFGDFLQLDGASAGHLRNTIVDSLGRPLFASGPGAGVDYTRPLSHPLISDDDVSAREYTGLGGVEMLGALVPIPGYPWRLIVELPAAEAFGELRALGGMSLLLEIIFGLLLVAMAWLAAAEIVAPLGRLVHAARRVAGGDLTVRVVASEADEIGELSRAFNEMTSALADSTRRVAELHHREIERASQLATVGELASGLAHEIKNPVVGISNGLDLVRRRIGPDAALSPITDEMARQLARIQQTLQELLTFARPATPALAPVSAEMLVDRATRLIQPTARRSDVTIVTAVDPELPRFLADEEMLHQALVNVLMNALQATPAGGHIRVDARLADAQVELCVTDSGRGIPPEELESVFKPFFTTRHTGTGLGLSITREIAQRHGGTVTLESKVGVGTTIVIRLPFTAAGAAVPAEEPVAV